MYTTVEFPPHGADDEVFRDCVHCVAGELTAVLPEDPMARLLVIGLGNREVTPDAVGPQAVENTVVTRHLITHLPDTFGHMRPVAALAPGVLGSTGLESAEIIQGVVEKCRPDAVILVDALASMSLKRLCTTVQITDTGIVPGSGVGNARAAINQDLLQVPVVAMGVPTVVDAATLAAELLTSAGQEELADQLDRGAKENMIVTPKDIDARVREISRLVGYSINLAAHPDLSFGDFSMFLS